MSTNAFKALPLKKLGIPAQAEQFLLMCFLNLWEMHKVLVTDNKVPGQVLVRDCLDGTNAHSGYFSHIIFSMWVVTFIKSRVSSKPSLSILAVIAQKYIIFLFHIRPRPIFC